ncbi:hypothetical protein EJB05_34972 [Eragrostis curvula]|uniref:Uncharacterized protein n=1 Tax=Eragrostis curvula TaxID=38414 RepID=A0A5J9U5V6_9POAL|nr:hypothetical protein EJB05_34972 [Eragrostis curvula]
MGCHLEEEASAQFSASVYKEGSGRRLLLQARVKEGAASGQLLDQQETPSTLLFHFGARRTRHKDKKRPRDSYYDTASVMPKKRLCRRQAAPVWEKIVAHFPMLEPLAVIAIDIPRALRVRTMSNLVRNNNIEAHPSPASFSIQIYGNNHGNTRKERWIFFIKILSLLCFIYGTTGALAIASSKIVKGQFVFGWAIPPWAVYLIQFVLWWLVVKPSARYRAKPLVRKLLPLACYVSNSATAFFVSSNYGGYSGLRLNVLLPLVLLTLVPYAIWSLRTDKVLELKPLFWWCFGVLAFMFQPDTAGFIPLPGTCNKTDYFATLAAAVFLLDDVLQADCRNPIMRTLFSIYTNTSLDTENEGTRLGY